MLLKTFEIQFLISCHVVVMTSLCIELHNFYIHISIYCLIIFKTSQQLVNQLSSSGLFSVKLYSKNQNNGYTASSRVIVRVSSMQRVLGLMKFEVDCLVVCSYFSFLLYSRILHNLLESCITYPCTVRYFFIIGSLMGSIRFITSIHF